MRSALQTFLAEPRAENPPRRVWRDWLLVGLLVPGVLIESALRTDIAFRPAATGLALAIAVLLLWRRTHPLLTFALAFGGVLAFDLTAGAFGWEPIELYTTAALLLFMYSLFRWGSGREIAVGTGLAIALTAVANAQTWGGIGDLIGGFIALTAPAEIALAVRYQIVRRAEREERAKVEERELLARELHDTVAHHVSAIVIQAQAGQFLAQSESLEGATNALAVIEEEASRTLAEMRTIVGVLRDADTAVAMAPQHGIGDIEALAATPTAESPEVSVELSGQLDRVSPSVGAAAYRIAQESVTNALRHARNASAITVRVDGQPKHVVLTVSDDGDMTSRDANPDGFGLIGMRERVTLLDGMLDTGPTNPRGWVVRATLPRQAAS